MADLNNNDYIKKLGQLKSESEVLSATALSSMKEWVEDNTSKVYIKNPDVQEYSDGAKSDLSVIKLTLEEYGQILRDGASPNTLYLVSGDFINAYGQQIKNLAGPELSDDAATKNYVDSNDAVLSSLANRKIFIDGISADTLSAVHVSQDEFHQKVVDETILSNEMYVVSNDYINAYGEQIKNLAEGTDLSDAVTLQQMNSLKNGLAEKLNAINNLSGLNSSSNFEDVSIGAILSMRDILSSMLDVLKA